MTSINDSSAMRVVFEDSGEVTSAGLLFEPNSGDFYISTGNHLYLGTMRYPTGDGTNGQVLATNGSNTISFTSTVPSASVAVSASYAQNAATATSASFATTASFSTISNTVYNNNTSSGSIGFWQGTTAEYNAISGSASNSIIYFVI
jgi:hypothetical protein